MKVDQALALAEALAAAAQKAQLDGRDEIDLTAELTALDDAARADLQSAINGR